MSILHTKILPLINIFPAVEVVNQEVILKTGSIISCKITDIHEQMTIEWSGFEQGNDFVSEQGTYDPGSKSQTGTLTVKSAAVTVDKTYTCTVSSVSNPTSDTKSTDIELNVYGTLSFLHGSSFYVKLYSLHKLNCYKFTA